MNKPSKTNIQTFVRFNNRTFECGKYTFVPALVSYIVYEMDRASKHVKTVLRPELTVCACMHMCLCVCLCVCVYMLHVFMCLCMCIYMCVSVCTCVCVCLYDVFILR